MARRAISKSLPLFLAAILVAGCGSPPRPLTFPDAENVPSVGWVGAVPRHSDACWTVDTEGDGPPAVVFWPEDTVIVQEGLKVPDGPTIHSGAALRAFGVVRPIDPAIADQIKGACGDLAVDAYTDSQGVALM